MRPLKHLPLPRCLCSKAGRQHRQRLGEQTLPFLPPLPDLLSSHAAWPTKAASWRRECASWALHSTRATSAPQNTEQSSAAGSAKPPKSDSRQWHGPPPAFALESRPCLLPFVFTGNCTETCSYRSVGTGQGRLDKSAVWQVAQATSRCRAGLGGPRQCLHLEPDA